jgi:hypothetical protein
MTATTTRIKDIVNLIKLASTVEAADNYIEEFTGRYTFKEKLEFLSVEFGAKIIGRSPNIEQTINNDAELEDDYWAILNAIISKKWR